MVIGDAMLPDGPGLGFDNTQFSPTLTYSDKLTSPVRLAFGNPVGRGSLILPSPGTGRVYESTFTGRTLEVITDRSGDNGRTLDVNTDGGGDNITPRNCCLLDNVA